MAAGDKCNSFGMCSAVAPKQAYSCLFEDMQCLCRSLDGIQCDIEIRDLIETIPLFEGRLHIPTIKDAFMLRVAKTDGALAPVDSQGFTYPIFKPGDTLNISGTSAESAATPGTTLSGSASMALSTMVQYDMHHQHPRHLADCHDAKHLCILCLQFVKSWVQCLTATFLDRLDLRRTFPRIH